MNVQLIWRLLIGACLLLPMQAAAQDGEPNMVVPGAIVVSEFTCEDGDLVGGAIAIEDESGAVQYSVEGPFADGSWSVVASLTDTEASQWESSATEPWSLQEDGSMTASGILAVPDCSPVEPQDDAEVSVEPEDSAAADENDDVEVPGETDDAEVLTESDETEATDEQGDSVEATSFETEELGGIGVFAATCPAAATGVQHMNPVTHADVSLNGEPVPPGGPIELPYYDHKIRVDYDYAVTNAEPGDWFEIAAPANLWTPGFSRTLTVDPEDPDSTPVACMTVSGSKITVVFLDYVEDRPLFEGELWLEYRVDISRNSEEVTVTTEIEGILGEIDIIIEGIGPVGVPQEFQKVGWVDRNAEGKVIWGIDVPASAKDLLPITITDEVLGSNWTIACDEPVIAETIPYNEVALAQVEWEFAEPCSETGFTIRLTAMPESDEYAVRFRIIGVAVEGSQPPYQNKATFYTDETEIIFEDTATIRWDGGGSGDGNQPTPTPTPPTPTPTDPPVTETPTPTDPPVTETPMPTDPPVTETPMPTDPPVTETPAPTDVPATPTVPPATESPENPTPVVPTELPNTGNGSVGIDSISMVLVSLAAFGLMTLGLGLRLRR